LYLVHAFEGENFDLLKERKDVVTFLKPFSGFYRCYPRVSEDFFKNPTSTLVTMKCFPWTYGDKVALIGDACHAIVPFMEV
jgi:kynurenine 3-monooxygenase